MYKLPKSLIVFTWTNIKYLLYTAALFYKLKIENRLDFCLQKTVYGCFTHLRIVHQTDGPAWMNHLTDCPL